MLLTTADSVVGTTVEHVQIKRGRGGQELPICFQNCILFAQSLKNPLATVMLQRCSERLSAAQQSLSTCLRAWADAGRAMCRTVPALMSPPPSPHHLLPVIYSAVKAPGN